jgi:ribosomal protein S18 acetylase RimI-like enzyme
VEIREFSPRDVDAFQAIRLQALQTNPEAFGETVAEFEQIPLEVLRVRTERNYHAADTLVLGAFEGERAVGMMGWTRFDHSKRRHKSILWGVYVDPAWRGRGVGHNLLTHVISHASVLPGLEQIQLSVVSGNAAAIALYNSAGFVRYGYEKQSFKTANGQYEDQLLMVKFMEQS